MSEASGDFWIGEAKGCSWALSRRVVGFGLGSFMLFLAGMVAAELLLPILVDVLLPDQFDGLFGLPLVAIIAVAGWVGWMRWRAAALKKAWTSRGVSNPSATSFRVEEQGFVVSTPTTESTFRWAAVTEIAPLKGYWIYVVPGLGYTVPRRFFADQDSERAFLLASLEHMSEEARARSREAVAFADGGRAP